MSRITYTAAGPWLDGSPPGIAASVLNNIETFLTAGWFDSAIFSDGAGMLTVVKLALTTGSFTRVAKFGAYAVSTSTNTFAHNLGVVPDLILLTITGATATTRTVCYDDTYNDATNMKLTGNASFNVRGLAIKF
jgi:hypothetical protein